MNMIPILLMCIFLVSCYDVTAKSSCHRSSGSRSRHQSHSKATKSSTQSNETKQTLHEETKKSKRPILTSSSQSPLNLMHGLWGFTIANMIMHKRHNATEDNATRSRDSVNDQEAQEVDAQTQADVASFFNWLKQQICQDITISQLEELFKTEDYEEGGKSFHVVLTLLNAFYGYDCDSKDLGQALQNVEHDIAIKNSAQRNF